LLAELARRGAIGALLDRDGNDLLPGGASFRPPSPARAGSARSLPSQPPVSAAAPAAQGPTRAPAPAAAQGSPPPAVTLGDAVLEAASAAQIPRAPSVPSFAPDPASVGDAEEPPDEGAAHQAAVARAAFDGAEDPEQLFFAPADTVASATDGWLSLEADA